MIKYNGYYVSLGKDNEEWHAGIHMKYRSFYAYSFYKDGTVMVAAKRTSMDIDRCDFNEIEFVRTKDLSNFIVEKSKLKIYRDNGQINQEFEIANDHKLINEFGIIYIFRPFIC